MTVEVKMFGDLDAVERDADGALDRGEQLALFDRIAWLRLTARHFPALAPLICRARSGAATGWLFLAQDGRRAVPFGSWYTLDFRPVFAGAGSDDVKRSLLAAIAGRLRGTVATLALQPLREHGADLLVAGFADAGWRARRSTTSANWTLAADGLSPGAYLAARPSKLRATLARKRRLTPLEILIIERFDAAAWHDYEAVFARSWKPQEGSMPFLRALAEEEADAGTLRLALGYHDGRPVAAQLWLVENGVATIHKLAHDRDADRGSPGTQLTAAMFAHVLDRDHPRLVDFGAGDDPYKADWMDRRRPLFTLELADPRSPAGLAATLRWRAARLVRRRPSD